MKFNPSRLTLARQRRGATKTKLADELGITPRSITAYEAGDTVPSEEKVAAFARVLEFPISFFSAHTIEVPTMENASFRSLSSMTSGQRDSALGAGALAIELGKWIERNFEVPAPALPELHHHSPEAAAESLRAAWGIGERPVKNMVHLLEAHGVRVFSLVQECNAVDAFSVWRDATPYVFLNYGKSSERNRFDAAHELGHLLLHRHGAPQGRQAEHEADAFASAFLMPRASVLAAAPRLPTVDHLVQLKRTWNVSVAALAHRLRSLEMLSEWHYRSICIEIAQRGYRRKEPNGILRESSQLLAKVFQVLREEGSSKASVAEQLNISTSELDALIFGLAMTPVQGGRSQDAEPRPGRAALKSV